jgi:pimeloyl-ACP methyl ester carboxylesterase
MQESTATYVDLPGYDLEMRVTGSGQPLLLLHGEQGPMFCDPLAARLAERFTVMMPSHPGWAGSPRSSQFRSVTDIAFMYLDLMDTFDEPICVVGTSFGAWVAAEIGSMCSRQISSLVLVSPLGIRPDAEPEARTFIDLYAASPEAVTAAHYGQSGPRPDPGELADDDFVDLARAQESFAFFSWEPYLHNPSLLSRLHRIQPATLLTTGSEAGVVLVDKYLSNYASAIGDNASIAYLPGAGHRVEEQLPVEMAELIIKHVSLT